MKSNFLDTREAILMVHKQDPNSETGTEGNTSSEYIYALRMEEMLSVYEPKANENLKLACLCQHFRRWEIARSSFTPDRKGYHQWRRKLYEYQADKAGELLISKGYQEETVARIRVLISKSADAGDIEAQFLQDVTSLVFVKYYLKEFSKKHTEDKLLDIIRKTKKKMSEKALAFVGNLGLEKDLLTLLTSAS